MVDAQDSGSCVFYKLESSSLSIDTKDSNTFVFVFYALTIIFLFLYNDLENIKWDLYGKK